MTDYDLHGDRGDEAARDEADRVRRCGMADDARADLAALAASEPEPTDEEREVEYERWVDREDAARAARYRIDEERRAQERRHMAGGDCGGLAADCALCWVKQRRERP